MEVDGQGFPVSVTKALLLCSADPSAQSYSVDINELLVTPQTNTFPPVIWLTWDCQVCSAKHVRAIDPGVGKYLLRQGARAEGESCIAAEVQAFLAGNGGGS